MMVQTSVILIVLVCLTQVKSKSDDIRIQSQKNFRNLFNSLARNDEKEISINQDILKREAAREQEVFATMNNELQTIKRRKAYMDYENLARYRRDGTTSNPTTPGDIKCASITQDEGFQAVFRKPSILLSFLNDVIGKTLPNAFKLTDVDIRAEEQDMYAEGQYHIFLDIRAQGDDGNTYVIEMERACQLHDVIRFQYTAARVFVQLINDRFKTLRAAAKKAAEEKTAKKKAEAENAAKKEAEAANAKSHEVREAMAKAAKEVKEAISKPIDHEQLFNPKDVPTVIVIVIVEGGMPKRKYSSKFTLKDYTLVTSFEKFGDESKIKFIYIDLTKFAATTKLEDPITPLDLWCSFLWCSAKDKLIKQKLWKKVQKSPSIIEAVNIISAISTQEELKLEAKGIEEETLRVEGRDEQKLDFARKMLKKKRNDESIIDYTDISAEGLEDLKWSL